MSPHGLAAWSLATTAAGLTAIALGWWPGPALMVVALLLSLAAYALTLTPTEDPAMTAPASPLAVAILDQGGHLAVTVDRHDGRGPYLVLTVPTGRGTQVPEARREQWARAVAEAQSMARDYGVVDTLPIVDDRPRRRQGGA